MHNDYLTNSLILLHDHQFRFLHETVIIHELIFQELWYWLMIVRCLFFSHFLNNILMVMTVLNFYWETLWQNQIPH